MGLSDGASAAPPSLLSCSELSSALQRDRLRGVVKIFPEELCKEGDGEGDGSKPDSSSSSSSSAVNKDRTQHPKGRDWFWDNKTFNVAFFGASESGHCRFCYRDTSRSASPGGASSLLIERCHVHVNYCDQQCRDLDEHCAPIGCKRNKGFTVS